MFALFLLALFASPASASRFGELANAALVEPDPEKALELMAAALKAWEPSDGRDALKGALVETGLKLNQRDRPEEALGFFDEALKIDPDSVPARANRSHSLQMLHRFDESIVDAKRALRLMPELKAAKANLCANYMCLDRWHEALDWCGKFNAELGDSWFGLQQLAHVQAMLGRHQEARATYERSIGAGNRANIFEKDRHKYDMAQRLSLAQILWPAGKFDEAERLFDRLAEENKTVAHVFYHRGRMRLAQGRTERAIEDFNHALALDRRFVESVFWRAAAHEKAGRPTLAAKDRDAACKRGWRAACPKKR